MRPALRVSKRRQSDWPASSSLVRPGIAHRGVHQACTATLAANSPIAKPSSSVKSRPTRPREAAAACMFRIRRTQPGSFALGRPTATSHSPLFLLLTFRTTALIRRSGRAPGSLGEGKLYLHEELSACTMRSAQAELATEGALRMAWMALLMICTVTPEQSGWTTGAPTVSPYESPNNRPFPGALCRASYKPSYQG